MNIEPKDFIEAWDRIARTPDGHLIYRYLHMRILGVLDDADPSFGALRGEHERRRFIAELMGLMSKGLDESAGSSTTDRPIVIRRAGPVASSRNASVRERIAASDPEYAAIYAGHSPGNSG